MRTMLKTIRQRAFGLAVLLSAFSGVPFANAQDLTIGSKAPNLDIEHWISNGHDKFKPVKEFETGKVYVVEFWATWCGPCVMSMPHLKETQEKYADKGVQLISISDEETEVVDRFLEKQVRGSAKDDTENTYRKLTSAYCLTTDPDKSVYEAYMDAAGQNGIPTCFIVGKSGLIEWIGHPMSMDDTLEKVVAGTWDREAHLIAFKKEQQMGLLMAKIARPLQSGDMKGAMKILTKAKEEAAGEESTIAVIEEVEVQVKLFLAMQDIENGKAEDALAAIEAIPKTDKAEIKQQIDFAKCKALLGIVSDSGKMDEQATKALAEIAERKEIAAEMLNELAWTVYEAASENDKFPKKLIAAAADAAGKAVAKSPNNGPILDTLAHLLYLQGNLDRAIEFQTKAVEHGPEEMKQDLQSFLDDLKKEKAKK